MTAWSRLAAVALICLAMFGGVAAGHEVRPAYLQINEEKSGRVTILWKQPTLGDRALRLEPRLSNDLLSAAPADSYAAGGYLIRHWDVRLPQDQGLENVRIDIEGLENSITDVLVHVRRPETSDFQTILRPGSPSTHIPSGSASYDSRFDFLKLGISHILTGPDHLLFVFGLLLLIPGRRALLITITAFTIAHSITLAVATIWRPHLPLAFLETLVALSILILGAEIIRIRRDVKGLTSSRPWVVAFAFGLLHGLAFSTGLASFDLGSSQLASALLLFNLGVELGQLGFVVAVMAAWKMFQLTKVRLPTFIEMLPPYVIGSLGAFWMLQNLRQVFSQSG